MMHVAHFYLYGISVNVYRKVAATTLWCTLIIGIIGLHTTDFATQVVVYWLESELSQWVHQEGSI